MGGTSSQQDNRRPIRGGIFVQVGKSSFMSGEAIQGTLSVSLEENFQGHILQVSLEGIEETHYTYQVSSGSGKHRHTRTVHAHGFNKFLDFPIPIFDFSNGRNDNNFILSPGQWQIPFQIIVANQLPSSLTYFSTASTNCQLKYRICATIIPTDPSIRPVLGIQDIFIAQQINMIPNEQIQSRQIAPNTCCCCGSAPLTISGSTDKQSYAPGEVVHVLVDSDLSNYPKTVLNLHVDFVGTLTMKTQAGHRTKVLPIFQIEKTIPVTSKMIKERVEIPIPAGIQLTSSGNLVNLIYNVRITPEVDGCCRCNTPGANSLFFPVMLNPTSQTLNMVQAPQLYNAQAPQNWNPTQLQPAQFNSQQAAYIQRQQTQYQQIELTNMPQYDPNSGMAVGQPVQMNQAAGYGQPQGQNNTFL